MDRHSYRNTIPFERCFTSASAHTFNFSSFRASFVTDKVWATNRCENIKYLPCLQERWSRNVWKCASYQRWFVYSFHPWHAIGRLINGLIVQDGVVSLALGFFPSLCLQQSLSSSWNVVCCCLFWDPRSGLIERAPYDSLIEPWQGWQLHRAGGSLFSHLSWAMPDRSGCQWSSFYCREPQNFSPEFPQQWRVCSVTHVLQSMLSMEVLA